jgi:hypothetical protein
LLAPIGFDRDQEFQRMIVNGEPKPEGLTADEESSWETSVLQINEALEAGEVLDFPNE